MIFVKLQGRLGNQMFQYAFAYTAAKKSKTCFALVESEYYFKYTLHYFKVRLLEKVFLKIATSWFFRFHKKKNVCKQYEDNVVLSYNDIVIKNNLIYDGFFQSEHFFHEYKHVIKKFFTIKKKYRNAFSIKYNYILQNSSSNIVIHFRGGDYKNWGNKDYTLPFQYYNTALKLISDYVMKNIIIVTDDVTLAQEKFATLINATFISDSEINDFQLLLHADKLIISNSSFAWWGAYLNCKNAEVFAPKYWLGFHEQIENPYGIMSVNWNWLEFKS